LEVRAANLARTSTGNQIDEVHAGEYSKKARQQVYKQKVISAQTAQIFLVQKEWDK
jgi:hypothetical protein